MATASGTTSGVNRATTSNATTMPPNGHNSRAHSTSASASTRCRWCACDGGCSSALGQLALHHLCMYG
eukprot:1160459-Pelagomonas_calceolata.AAC.3